MCKGKARKKPEPSPTKKTFVCLTNSLAAWNCKNCRYLHLRASLLLGSALYNSLKVIIHSGPLATDQNANRGQQVTETFDHLEVLSLTGWAVFDHLGLFFDHFGLFFDHFGLFSLTGWASSSERRSERPSRWSPSSSSSSSATRSSSSPTDTKLYRYKSSGGSTSIGPPDNLSTWQFVHLTICPPDNLSIWQFVHLTICPSDNFSSRPSPGLEEKFSLWPARGYKR